MSNEDSFTDECSPSTLYASELMTRQTLRCLHRARLLGEEEGHFTVGTRRRGRPRRGEHRCDRTRGPITQASRFAGAQGSGGAGWAAGIPTKQS